MYLTHRLTILSDPGDEPEVTQNGIEFVTRLLIKSPVTFLQLSASGAAEFFFLFALQVLDGKEPLPKAAAADFWVCNSYQTTHS